MKYITTLAIALMTVATSYSQEWHNAKDTLKAPKNRDITLTYWIKNNRYDTVICRVENIKGEVFTAYKIVYLKNGYYIEDAVCFGRFLQNDKKSNLFKIRRYMFF